MPKFWCFSCGAWSQPTIDSATSGARSQDFYPHFSSSIFSSQQKPSTLPSSLSCPSPSHLPRYHPNTLLCSWVAWHSAGRLTDWETFFLLGVAKTKSTKDAIILFLCAASPGGPLCVSSRPMLLLGNRTILMWSWWTGLSATNLLSINPPIVHICPTVLTSTPKLHASLLIFTHFAASLARVSCFRSL